ncbi:MAG: sugar ABC transporter ATP-binding protein [Thermaceae bacterium]|nr:sugar ABC transporter ATP-binding protein [Thermaceae bacterium]
MTPLLSAIGIKKTFGHVTALKGVDFAISPGETVALVGDNGAGKSTLMKVLCGVYQPDEGELRINDRLVVFKTPREAITAGISVVHQNLALVDVRDVTHNVFLGAEPTKGLFVDRYAMEQETYRLLQRLKLNIPPDIKVGELSGGQRQSVAIARAIHQGGQLVIMDEPTAALGVQEQAKVLKLIGDLREHGTAVCVVSHNLEHVFHLADRIVVLRGGAIAGERKRSETNPQEIVHLITGANVVVGGVG